MDLPCPLLCHKNLSNLLEPERQERVFGVGSVLMQIVAVQQELGEPLNLNGDILQDLVSGCITRYISDGPKALEAMFAAIAMSGSDINVKSSTVVQQMLDFNNAHAFYDPDFRPPTFRRERPSIITPTVPIPVVLKRKGDAKIDGEKQAKRAKTSINGKNTESTDPHWQVKGAVWGKRLRTHTDR